MRKLLFTLAAIVAVIVLQAQTVTVRFEVTVPEGIPQEGKDIYISGALPPVANWPQPGTNTNLKMSLKPGTNNVYTITLQLNPGQIQFKFFQATASAPTWDLGEWPGDPNRVANISDNTLVTATWGDVNTTQTQPLASLANVKNTSKVFPTVTSTYVNVNTNNAKISVLDLCGKNILTTNLDAQGVIDLTNYPSGVYFIKIEDKEGIFIQKIVKQ